LDRSKLRTQIPVGCEQRPANEAERSSPHRVACNRRRSPADVVQRAEQPRTATEHRVSAGDPSRSDKCKPVHAARLLRSQLGRNEPAERMADEIHALEPRGLEPTAEPTGQLTSAKPRSQPRQVEHVNTVTLGQGLENRLPPAPGA
jgi:hypothetical protein